MGVADKVEKNETKRGSCFNSKTNEDEERKRVSSLTWVKVKQFIGTPRRSDFALGKEELPAIKRKEILLESLCWTTDHYMKIFDVALGSVMVGEQVASVIDTLHEDYPLNALVACACGWRTHAIVNPEEEPVRRLIDIDNLPASLYLGTLGLPGMCAYFGLLELCRLKGGETVVINAAAGSVGNVVGQIAKIKGGKVIAFAGSKERCEWVRELGFDYVFNYNSIEISAALKRVAPLGVDCYFDCVGAKFTEAVLDSMKAQGSICVCGYVHSYALQTSQAQVQGPYRLFSTKDGHVISSSVHDFAQKFPEAESKILEWIHLGKLKYREVLFNGFERLPDALTALYDGRNVGKIIVKSAFAANLQTMVVNV